MANELVAEARRGRGFSERAKADWSIFVAKGSKRVASCAAIVLVVKNAVASRTAAQAH